MRRDLSASLPPRRRKQSSQASDARSRRSVLFEALEPRLVLAAIQDWSIRGVGGGGALFSPSFNPTNPSEMYIASDMGQVFHTTNEGALWDTVDHRELHGGAQLQGAVHGQSASPLRPRLPADDLVRPDQEHRRRRDAGRRLRPIRRSARPLRWWPITTTRIACWSAITRTCSFPPMAARRFAAAIFHRRWRRPAPGRRVLRRQQYLRRHEPGRAGVDQWRRKLQRRGL